MIKKSWKDLVFTAGLANLASRVAVHWDRPYSYGLQRWIWSKIQEAALQRPIFSRDRSEALLLVDLEVAVFCFLARRVLWSKYPYVMSRTGSIFLFEDFDFSHFETVPRQTPRKLDFNVRDLMQAAVKAVDEGSLNCPTYHGLQHKDRLKSLELPDKREDAVVVLESIIRQSIHYAANSLSSVKEMTWRGHPQLMFPVVCNYHIHPEVYVVVRYDGRDGRPFVPTFLSKSQVYQDISIPKEVYVKSVA